MRITLDAETFRALASTTRLAVLRALDERRKTLSELSRDLELNKATVHEHLQLLATAELVKKRDDEGRKWIYYELTWRGQKILHPQETTTFNVLLGLTVLAAGGGGALLVRSLVAARDAALLATPPTSQQPLALPAYNGDTVADGAASDSSTASAASASSSASSSGSASSASSASSTAPAAGPAGAGSFPQEANNANNDSAKSLAGGASHPAEDHSGLLGEGGALALALLGASALFGLLALLLRRKLRPKSPEQPGLE